MDVELVDLARGHVVGLHEVVPVEALPEYFGRAFAAAAGWLGRRGLAPAGPPTALYRGPVTETTDVTAGFAMPEGHESADGLTVVTLPAGPAAVAVHVGPYDEMTTTWGALQAWITDRGATPAALAWEEYLVGPDAEPDPALWRTRCVWPLD